MIASQDEQFLPFRRVVDIKAALPQNLWVVLTLISGATVAFSQAWLGRSMAGRTKVALAV